MEKRVVTLPVGTYFELSTLKNGNRAIFVKPDGTCVSTSPVQRYFVGQNGCYVETQNTVYHSRPYIA